MKRSHSIRLALLGSMAAGALAGCGRSDNDFGPPVSADNTYTNNHYTRGVGYYHAPYRAWYPYPFNHYEPSRGYYRGGTWLPSGVGPDINATKPTHEAVVAAHAQQEHARASVRRNGFGSSSHRTWS